MRLFLVAMAALLITSALSTPCIADSIYIGDPIMGARALGMGGAFVAVPDDPFAPYWNPAGIGQVPHAGIVIPGVTIEGADPFSFDFACTGGEVPPVDYAHETGIPLFSLNLGESAFSLFVTSVVIQDADELPEYIHILDCAQTILTGMYTTTWQISDDISYGLNIKVIGGTVDVCDEARPYSYPSPVLPHEDSFIYGETYGLSFDLGVLWISGSFRFGAVIKDVGLMHLDGSAVIGYPMSYDTYQIVPGLLYTSPTLKLGTAYINERTRTLLAGQVDWFVGHSYLVLRLGVEQPLLFFRLRAGATYTTGDILRLAGGLGLSLGPFHADLGCMVDPALKTTGASVSLSVAF